MAHDKNDTFSRSLWKRKCHGNEKKGVTCEEGEEARLSGFEACCNRSVREWESRHVTFFGPAKAVDGDHAGGLAACHSVTSLRPTFKHAHLLTHALTQTNTHMQTGMQSSVLWLHFLFIPQKHTKYWCSVLLRRCATLLHTTLLCCSCCLCYVLLCCIVMLFCYAVFFYCILWCFSIM